MKWGRKKKAALVPGRDRPPADSSRPTYSYYQARSGATSTERGRADVTPSAKDGLRGRFSPHSWLLIVYVIVALVCAGKILLLTPKSKIVVNETRQDLQLPLASYASSADQLLKNSLFNTNKITLNTNGIAKDMKKRYPELAGVVVAVPLLGNRPVIYVTPSRAAFNIEASSGVYTIADNGYVLAKVAEPEKNLLVLTETGTRQPEPGKQFLPASTVRFAASAAYQLQQAGHTVSRLELPASAPYELQVQLAGKPYRLRFNVQADVLLQSGAAVATMIKLGGTQPTEYVDVRVPGKVYYK